MQQIGSVMFAVSNENFEVSNFFKGCFLQYSGVLYMYCKSDCSFVVHSRTMVFGSITAPEVIFDPGGT